MQNLAGHPKATELIAIELQKAGIPIEMLDVPYGEPRATLGGSIGKFIFRRAWVYWTVRVEGGAEMSESHARQINDADAVSVVGPQAHVEESRHARDRPNSWAFYDSSTGRPDRRRLQPLRRELAKGLEPSTPCLQGVWDFVPTPS